MKLSPKVSPLHRLQDYAQRPSIEGVTTHELRRFNDAGGSMVELLRLSGGAAVGIDGFQPAQVNFSSLHPGVAKAFHLHQRQTDVWFVAPEDRILVVLVDVRADSETEGQTVRLLLGDGKASLVRIPPGVAHGCRNLGERTACIIYFTDLHFKSDPEEGDEGRLPWDFVGKDVWEVAWD